MMSRWTLLLFALGLYAAPKFWAADAAPAAAPAETPESPPAEGQISRLEIAPERIELKRSTDYVQVVVLARLTSGETSDVTRLVQSSLSSPVAQISPRGVVKPLADGQAEAVFILGQKQVKVPVTVANVAAPLKVDYVRDCMPVISKAGCNQGTCHGAKEGKAGFKLSLRGYDPIFDIRAWTDDAKGRRTNVASPDDSLMLLKATGAVPHEAGQVMAQESDYYKILRTWIADGLKLDLKTPRVTKIEVFPNGPVLTGPGSRQQMRVTATYADGLARDVTAEAFVESGNTEVLAADKSGLVTAQRRGEAAVLARFEGSYASTVITVMGDRSGFVWQEPPTNNEIDRFVIGKLKRMRTLQSPLCNDTEFVRRIYLDLTGLPPMPEEVRAFLNDRRDSRWKRDELVDRLIGSEDWVEHWANKWADLLQVNSKFLGGEGAKLFRDWIRAEVKANTPYDQFVRKILTAGGSNKENPPASYFKILREPAEIMENTTHLFLATRFNCNKCHDHPFERWTQDNYYHLTAYFARTALERDPASGDRNLGGTAVEGAKPLYEKVVERNDGETKHERTGAVTPPQFPYDAKIPAVAKEPSRREQLAAWITSADNQYFARSLVNRLWGYLTGTGLIEPLDDIRAGNPPTNPELLDWLTRQFVESGFNTQHVMRLICKSRAYQLSVASNRWNEDDQVNYSHAKARRLPAETLFDAIYRVTGATTNIPGVAPGTRAAALPDSQMNLQDGFLTNLGRPVRESACECERSAELQMGPVMALVSGPTVGEAISQSTNALTKMAAEIKDDRRLVDELFLRFLARPAVEAEINSALEVFRTMDVQHAELAAALEKYQAELAPVLQEKERQRQASIAAAKSDMDKHAAAIAPQVAAAQKQWEERMAAANKVLADFEAAGLPQKQGEWEKQQQGQTGWVLLNPQEMKSSQPGSQLQKESDLAIFQSGKEGKQTYTVTAETTAPTLTGIRLEALADDRLPGKGPGRNAAGNFVLSEFEVEWTPKGIPGASPQKIVFKDAFSTYNQGSYDVKSAIDGKDKETPNGWAIHPGGVGASQTAVFVLQQAVAMPKEGAVLKFVLKQNHPDGKHFLGKFRLSATSAVGTLNFGLPQPVLEALAMAPEQRTDAQKKALSDYFRSQDPDLKKLQAAAAEAAKPLPEDPKLVEFRNILQRAELPLPADPRLEQMKRDLVLSQQQLGNKRLIGAQDLAWALINNPSFLFNR